MQHNKKELIDVIKTLNIETDNWMIPDEEIVVQNVNDDIVNTDDGYVEVRDHQLYIVNAKKSGKQPILLPNPQVEIKINGSLLTKEQVVFSHDVIEWTTPAKKEYEIVISKDKLHVHLKLFPELFQGARLKNKKRASRFIPEIEVIPKEQDVNEMVSEIVENVIKKGIYVEINTTKIIQEILNPSFNEVVIAEGLPVIPSVDGFIEQFFSSNIEEILDEVEGTIDFKNRIKIPTVDAGEVIANIFPHKDGKSGYDVFGGELKPKAPKKVVIRSKPSVKLADDGKVIALLSGRPSLTGQSVKQFDILETHEIYGDVDMSTGNIFFNGDIIIRGNVKDGMRVDSSGNIYIYGNVYQSSITAAQNIYVFGNITNSKVNGGQFGLYYSTVYKIAQDLSLLINRLWAALKQMKQVMAAKKMEFNIGYVIATLIETKFKEIPQNVNKFRNILNEMVTKNYNLPLHFQIVLNAISKFKDYKTVYKIESEQSLQSIPFAINELIHKMEAEILEESDISFNNANYSQIKTNGKIIVLKEGVINTTLFAGTDIIFKKKNSVIRGGKVEAVKMLTAGTVGTEKGTCPILYSGEKMKLEKVYQARIKMRDSTVLIDEEVNNLELKYNEKNDQIESNVRLRK